MIKYLCHNKGILWHVLIFTVSYFHWQCVKNILLRLLKLSFIQLLSFLLLQAFTGNVCQCYWVICTNLLFFKNIFDVLHVHKFVKLCAFVFTNYTWYLMQRCQTSLILREAPCKLYDICVNRFTNFNASLIFGLATPIELYTFDKNLTDSQTNPPWKYIEMVGISVDAVIIFSKCRLFWSCMGMNVTWVIGDNSVMSS